MKLSHFFPPLFRTLCSKSLGLPADFFLGPREVKLVRAAQKALEVARKNNGGYNKAQALAAAAFVEVSELKTKWSLVQTFQQKQVTTGAILDGAGDLWCRDGMVKFV